MNTAAGWRRLAGQMAGWGKARQLSGGGASSAPHQPPLRSLKHALREVYKRVHPDLFQDYPPAKDANTRSFKMLQDYLEAARHGSKLPLPYRFHFYVRQMPPTAAAPQPQRPQKEQQQQHEVLASQQQWQQQERQQQRELPASQQQRQQQEQQTAAAAPAGAPADGGSAGAPPGVQLPRARGLGLQEVTLTLPPPTRGGPGEAMSGSTRKAFGRLLAALGLPSSFGAWGGGEGEEEQDEAAREYSRFVSLREFLPQAVEAVHQHAAAQSGAQHQLGALRAALRLGRRLAAVFGEPAASGGPLAQLPLLQRLVGVLDGLGPAVDLSGLRVVVGDAYGVDGLGAVWLAAEGSPEAWARHLSSVDAAHCRQRQQLLQQVRSQEAAVAAALGVAMIYPQQQQASLSPDYRHALERLAAVAAARGPVGGGCFPALPVMLHTPGVGVGAGAGSQSSSDPGGGGGGGGGTAPSSNGGGCDGSSGSGSGELGGCMVDSEAGLLIAPVGVPAEALYAAVQQLGGQVLAAAQRRQRTEAELAALRTQVERKVMLRRLLRDPAVSDARYKSCLDRMLGNAQRLQGLLHGQAVRVAEVNSLSPDKSVINIAWNWQM